MRICTQRMWKEPDNWRRVGQKERTEHCRQKLKLSKLAVGTTHPNAFIPDEHTMEQQTWIQDEKLGNTNPLISSFVPPFSVWPLWLLCLHPLRSLLSLPFFCYFPYHTGSDPPAPLRCLPWPSRSSASDSHFTLPVCSSASCTSVEQQSEKAEIWFPVSHNQRSTHLDFSFLIPWGMQRTGI